MSKAKEWAAEDGARTFARMKGYDYPRGSYSSFVARVVGNATSATLQMIDGRETGVTAHVYLPGQFAVEFARWILDTFGDEDT